MKSKEIAKAYSLNHERLDAFISKFFDKYNVRATFSSFVVEDNNVDLLVADYRQYLSDKAVEKAEREKEEIVKRSALANMLITSGFNFDGYTITKYSGYISGDDAVSVDRGFTFFGEDSKVKDKLLESLVGIRRNALAELKEAAYALGCNAVIGVDFDYLTLDPQRAGISGTTVYEPYVFGVTANGNAVIIEKNPSDKD